MKSIGLVRRTPADELNTFLVKLDMSCIPDTDTRKLFAVVDRTFGVLGTARVKETKHGLGVFELLIPGIQNATAVRTHTEKGTRLWGRVNTQCNNIFCIELDILCQDGDPTSYGYREYHSTHQHNRPKRTSQRQSRPLF